MLNSPASALRKAAHLRQYEHIPIPPTPPSASASSTTSQSYSGGGGGPSSAHESVYSAVSNFRSYRHTMERDRDSAMARMAMEDNFELENAAALEEARNSVATSAFKMSGASPRSAGNSRLNLHEQHPLSDDEEQEEEIEVAEQARRGGATNGTMHDDPTLRQRDFASPDQAGSAQQAQMALRSLSPNKENGPNPPMQQQPQRGNDYLKATPPPNHRNTSDSSMSSHAARDRAAGSLPETPTSRSPSSPFAFSPAPSSPSAGQPQRSTEAAQQMEQEKPFLRHHQKEPNGDFPVSVVSSRSAHYTEYTKLPLEEQPPMPLDMVSKMKHHEASLEHVDQRAPPPLPLKTATPPSSDRRPDWNSAEKRAQMESPAPQQRVPYHSPPQQEDNAGPTSEYRFPTASSRGRRPESVSGKLLSIIPTQLVLTSTCFRYPPRLIIMMMA